MRGGFLFPAQAGQPGSEREKIIAKPMDARPMQLMFDAAWKIRLLHGQFPPLLLLRQWSIQIAMAQRKPENINSRSFPQWINSETPHRCCFVQSIVERAGRERQEKVENVMNVTATTFTCESIKNQFNIYPIQINMTIKLH